MAGINVRIIHKYHDLTAYFVAGRMGEFLESLAVRMDPRIEVSRVYRDAGIAFMSGFSLSPPVDITFERSANCDVDLMVFGFNDARLQEIMDYLVSEAISTREPTGRDIRKSLLEFDAAIQGYDKARSAASILRVDVEQMWGTFYYWAFLERYRGLSKNDAMRSAFEKFGIPVPPKMD